jgi:hypothetical protein
MAVSWVYASDALCIHGCTSENCTLKKTGVTVETLMNYEVIALHCDTTGT